MTASRTEVLQNRIGDWKQAYDAVREDITPQPLRAMLDQFVNTPLPENAGDAITTFTARLNATLALARLVSANDRAAGTIAALMVAQGIKPTSFDYGDDT